MAGLYIRTASGIQAAKDWFIRVAAAPNSAHTMVAGLSGSTRGFQQNMGVSPYGSMTPLATSGIYEWRGAVWAFGSTGDPTIIYIADPNSTPIPADTDAVWQTIAFTGVFQDSSGATVTRTLTRSNNDFTSTDSTYGWRQWQFNNAKAAQFINGNTYTVAVTRNSGGSAITRVREAYIRTASGIQRYWPAPATVSLPNVVLTSTRTNASGLASSCTYRLTGSGDIFQVINGTATDLGDWLDPKAAAPGGYEFRATFMGGTTPTGTFGSWIPFVAATNYDYNVTKPGGSGFGALVGVMRIEIRNSAGLVLANNWIELHAEIPS